MSHIADDPNQPETAPVTDGRMLLPCTPAQERCWFLNQMQPGNPALNIAVRWELKGRVPSAIVEQAFRKIIARHESLRTRFVGIDGVPMQEPMEQVNFKLTLIDLQHLPLDQREARATEIGKQEAVAPFDLATPPLLRATMMQMEDDRALLLICVHQSVFDGWSIRVLGREIGTTIEALLRSTAPNLPELPLQYGDYALWLREYYDSGDFQTERDYWKKQLTGAPYFEVPTDQPRGERRTTNGAIVTTKLSTEVGKALEETPKRFGCSFFNFGCAIIGASLSRFVGKTDVTIGTQMAGREDVDLENLIGVFINNLVLRMNASGDPSFTEFLGRANGTMGDALNNQRMPFHKLVEMLNPARDLSRTPLIAINVILQRAFLEDASYDKFTLKGVPSPSPGAFYDLNFQMIGRDDGWRMSIEYNTDLYSAQTAESLLQHWRETLERVVADPSIKLSALPEAPARDIAVTSAPVIDLSPIVDRLKAHASVSDAHALKRGADAFAFVAPAADRLEALEALPDALRAMLEQDHIEPTLAGISVIRALPRRADGSIDEAALPAPRRFARALLGDVDTDIIARVGKIWTDVLKVDAVGPDSHFFDLGGHSMLAVQMIAKVHDQFGVRLDPISLFKGPTLREFASQLGKPKSAAAEDDWHVVRLTSGGAQTPIIAIDNPILYYGLAKQLGPDQPLTSLQLFHPNTAHEADYLSFEAIAADYVKLLKTAHPTGPYVLMGLCVAGLLAIEIARQLRAQGDVVEAVIAYDAWRPGYTRNLPFWNRTVITLADRLDAHTRRWQKFSSGEMNFGEWATSFKFTRAIVNAALALGWIKSAPKQAEGFDPPWYHHILIEARNRFTITETEGELLIFRSEQMPRGRLFDHNLGWRDGANGHVVVREAIGTHTTILSDANSPAIGAHVKVFLDAVRRKAPK
ncbi:MAG: condensation domain-containing protein [Hyphomonadaceae bacterium JAD_PAG50586_4]|nr:MAG: condensation domain-containing protein [Hyphomonadaceae bacterium JAD_PAG50586_4]